MSARRLAMPSVTRAVALAAFVVAPTVPAAQTAQRLGPLTFEFRDEFTSIVSAVASSDGTVFVSDNKEKTIRCLTRSGSTVVGKHGAGPGEYTIPGRMAMLRGDTLAVMDSDHARVVFFTTDGKPAGQLSANDFPKVESLPDVLANPHSLIGADDAGRLYFLDRKSSRPNGNSEVWQESLSVLQADRRTKTVRTMGQLRGKTSRVKVTGSGGATMSMSIDVNPLAVGEQAVVAPDGTLMIARLDPYHLSYRNSAGVVTEGAALRHDKAAVSTPIKAAALARRAAWSGLPNVRSAEQTPDWPALLPPFTSHFLQIDALGRVWLERPATTAKVTSYDVVDRTGKLLMVVNAAGDLRLIGFAGRQMLMARVDDDGLQVVRMYPLP